MEGVKIIFGLRFYFPFSYLKEEKKNEKGEWGKCV